MTFIWPWLLLTLLLIPILIWLYVRMLRKRRQAVNALGPLGVVQNTSGRELGRRRHVVPALFLIGLSLLLFALARPELPVTLPSVEGTVILAFDVSNSMLADDMEPTRMEAAKEAARIFVENQPSTIRLGVVAFGNGGLIVQPPTDVQADVLAAIDRISPQGATSLGQGIFTALNAIAGEPIDLERLTFEEGTTPEDLPPLDLDQFSSSVILLLTDGENTGDPEPLAVADLAAEAGIRIYPVGIGSSEGAVLAVDGFNVLTQLNEPVLQDIARLTNGRYYRAQDEESLQEIYKAVDLQLTLRGESMEITSFLAGIAALFFLIGGGLSMVWFGRIP
ncbi:MAG: VWA domain-containing protein [Anaerolineae bacterium]|nr:VWA domain-containing protein [Anaerolineae bacterium]